MRGIFENSDFVGICNRWFQISLYFRIFLMVNLDYRGHVPYRDSKLTRILQPALGGNANTAIICNITLAQVHKLVFVSVWYSSLCVLCNITTMYSQLHLSKHWLYLIWVGRFMLMRQKVASSLQVELCVLQIVFVWMRSLSLLEFLVVSRFEIFDSWCI